MGRPGQPAPRWRVLVALLIGVLVSAGLAGPALAADPGVSTTSVGSQPGVGNSLILRPPQPFQTAALCNAPCINLTYHNGSVMNATKVYLIYWLPSGVHFETDAAGDANYESLLQRYFNDIGGSENYNILTQYYDLQNGLPYYHPNSSVLAGTYLDTRAYPHAGTVADPLQDSDIRGAVTNAIQQNSWVPDVHSEFFVYTGNAIQSCVGFECSGTSYCAYHWWYNLNGTEVIYANEPDAATVNCTIPGTTYPNDGYADPTIGTSSHEFFEAASDPYGDGWFAINAAGEIGDECAWIYGPESANGATLTLNGHPYQVQLEWSNAANGCTSVFDGQFINFGPLASPTTYGGSFSVSATTSSLLPVTFTSLTGGVCSVAGTTVRLIGVGTCTVQAGQTGGGFYTAATPVLQATIVNTAPLTITANNQTMTYGAPVPSPLTASYSGLVNGDTPASLTTPPTCTTTATSSSWIGTYPITCGGAVDPNYAISYVPGTLTIVAGSTIDACYNPLTAGLDKVGLNVARPCGASETAIAWPQDPTPAAGTAPIRACYNPLTAALNKVSLGVARACGYGETAVTWIQGAAPGATVYACYNPSMAILDKVSLAAPRTCGAGETAVTWRRL